MLASPLIEAEEQQSLRADLRRELGALEREFAGVLARNPIEVRAKIELAKTALQHAGFEPSNWIVQLLESLDADVRNLPASALPGRHERSSAHLVRAVPGRDPEHVPPAVPGSQSAE
jgi:hypothetical protein